MLKSTKREPPRAPRSRRAVSLRSLRALRFLLNVLLVHFAVRIIGVVDLLAGRAVHARAGQRETYRPVTSVAGTAIESGDALALARSYVARLGLTELYAADLDAIMGGASQDTLVAALAAVGVPLWLDAGVSSVTGSGSWPP